MVGLLSACREEPQLLGIYKSYDPLVCEIEQEKIYFLDPEYNICFHFIKTMALKPV